MAPYQNYKTEVYDDLKQLYHASAEHFGNKPLFWQKHGSHYESITYYRFRADVDALGTALCARGLSGRRVIITGENGVDWATAYMAVICGVGVAVPLDKELSAEALTEIAAQTDAAAILYSSSLSEKIKALPSSILRISFGEIHDWVTEGRNLIREGDRSFLDAEIDPNAMSALVFTSGTTGQARGVMLSHRNICFNLSEMCKMVYVDDKDVFLSTLPLHHVYETTCGFLCPLYRGASIAFAESLQSITRNMQQIHPTIMLTVPLLPETLLAKLRANLRKLGLEKRIHTAIKMTNALPQKARLAAKKRVFAEIHKLFGGNLRLIITGGTPADPAMIQDLRDLGFSAIQGYGMTECSPIVALNRDSFFKDAAAGLATPGTLLDIDDPHDDGVGEIRFRGDNIMLGYFDRPDLTEKAIQNGWFYTGDLGYLDEDGFLFIVGRRENRITTSSGKTISPEELESMLTALPLVKEALVISRQNGTKRQTVALLYPDLAEMKALYGKDYTAEQLDLEMKKAVAEVNGRLAPHKRIKAYTIRSQEFPKNTSRKILRAEVE